jgi:acetoin utilization deacetylase AcuC-like enzyme
MTVLITHSACLEHLTPPGHPERPERLRAIEHALEHEKFNLTAVRALGLTVPDRLLGTRRRGDVGRVPLQCMRSRLAHCHG